MKRKVLGIVAAFFVFALSTCQAQQLQHVQIAGRDVAVWKPAGTPPPNGFPLIVFSHGFTGCNVHTKFLMEALAGADYLVLAPNHRDAGCNGGRYVFGGGTPKPEQPFRDAEKWNGLTYRDRREDMEVVLDAALANSEFDGVPVDTMRVGVVDNRSAATPSSGSPADGLHGRMRA
jgi:predicted dienelactone hydrolase